MSDTAPDIKDVSELKFDKNGLIPAIVQDFETNEVLMLAYMNYESVQRTIETGRTWFYSRSRQELWPKGETSGHVQKVKEIKYDCDADALLIIAEQVGAACHTGAFTCFYRELKI
ncbi:MAG: phosphoribosyl-AMP cyclohydrolase [Actinobacteria bacterium]|nr:phosphoribosyl-AMP cyclohydrolase [Actinomycetota bacterium]